MSLLIHADPVPLRLDEYGAARVGDSRVTLDRVISCYRQGYTPEQIVEAFDTLRLADVYEVIGYYLKHKDEVEAYLARREQEAEEVRRRIEMTQPPRPGFRDELLRRQAQAGDGDAPAAQ